MKKPNKDKQIADLQAEVETLKTIISMMPGNVYWRDTNGRYLGCNKNNADTLQLASPADIVGKTLEEITMLDPTIAAVVNKADFEIMETKQARRFEERGFDSSGKTAYYISQKSPLFNKQGKVIGLLGLSVNISDQKRAQRLLQIAKKKAEAVNRAQAQFLSMISHELRTPLTSILGFIRFLEKDNLAPNEKKECLKHIGNSGSYLLSLVNNILDYNKLEAGKMTLAKESVDLKKLSEDVISILSGAAKNKAIALNLEYDKTLPIHFISDSNVIKQLLINLISNAVKFTEKGHVTLRLKNLKTKSYVSEITFEIEDTGIGIPEDAIQSIFKRFHQLDNTYTRSSSLTGTGLGLAIVKKLVGLLGSTIEVKSVLHRGSIFYFTLTLQREKLSEQNTTLDMTETSLRKKSKQPNLLLVEDDQMIQLVHSRMLEELGCKTVIAECAKQALEKVSSDFDLLFVDIGLPDINGFKLIQKIRKKGFVMPIIALTGFSEESEQKRCIREGANGFAVKPVTPATLREILHQHLKDFQV